MKLSVIIPTHNRADILKTCLQKLTEQQGVNYEIIVVDDGSTDHTEKIVENLKSKNACLRQHYVGQENLKFIKQKASHQGVARNRGVKAAKGEIIVFIGDDIFVEPNFLQKHHDCHTKHPEENVVTLGFTTWDPNLAINSYMRFLENSGWQFGYNFLKPGWVNHKEPFKFFYTSNISLKKSFFEKECFDENFTCYGWEDIELGYRLWKKHNMKLYYEPQAPALHHHYLDESYLEKKMQNVGQSAIHFQNLHPKVQVIPKGWKAFLLKIASNQLIIFLCHILNKNIYYKIKSWQQFFAGLKKKSNSV